MSNVSFASVQLLEQVHTRGILSLSLKRRLNWTRISVGVQLMMLDPNTQSIWRMWCESTRTLAGSGCVIPCRVVHILSEAAFYAAFLLPL